MILDARIALAVAQILTGLSFSRLKRLPVMALHHGGAWGMIVGIYWAPVLMSGVLGMRKPPEVGVFLLADYLRVVSTLKCSILGHFL